MAGRANQLPLCIEVGCERVLVMEWDNIQPLSERSKQSLLWLIGFLLSPAASEEEMSDLDRWLEYFMRYSISAKDDESE